MKSMKRYDAISALHRLLTAKHQPPMSLERICEELQCSPSTAKRAIRDLRERFGHPIEYDRERGGYFYDYEDEAIGASELPGLWLTEAEMRALLVVRRLLVEIEPSIVGRALVPLGRKVESLLEAGGHSAGEVTRRVRIIPIASRPVADRVFRCLADAVLTRRRVAFLYRARSKPNEPERRRHVSPQRLVHYRDNWYLDGWCHEAEALRIFALDRIRAARLLEERAREIDDRELDAWLTRGYGIFAGEPVGEAILRFSPERSQWVAKERWHPAQKGRFLEDGSWQMTLPYSRMDELLMDILRHGPHVEVLAPAELRAAVAAALAEAVARYAPDRGALSEGA